MKFLLYKEMYLLHHEWAGGVMPTPNENRQRIKLIKNGDAEVIHHESEFGKGTTNRKIERKGS